MTPTATLRVLSVLGLVATVAAARASPALTLQPEQPNGDALMKAQFDAWATTHSKAYSPGADGADAKEYEHRLGVFTRNWNFVQRLVDMKANQTWELGFDGPFMDLEVHEFAARMGYVGKEAEAEDEATSFKYQDEEPVSAIDWREKGAVSEIKDQGQCVSCWSFSTTGVVESVNAVNTGNLVSLSEQELVSCDHVDKGCNGGEMTLAYRWIMRNNGLVPEADYGYTSGAGQAPSCDNNLLDNDDTRVKISGFEKLPHNEEALQKALSYHPISVAVDANQWQFYKAGVFTGLFGFCGARLNHGVLAVGMDTDAGYYIIKNSWGTVWGEEGYMRLAMNKGPSGPCGICKDASYPTQ